MTVASRRIKLFLEEKTVGLCALKGEANNGSRSLRKKCKIKGRETLTPTLGLKRRVGLTDYFIPD